MSDVSVRDEGSIVLLMPLSDAAHDWMDEHIPDDAMWFGGGLAVEHRYADPIIDGMIGDGLEVI